MKLKVNENNVRLDVYLTKNTELSRTKIQKLINKKVKYLYFNFSWKSEK